MPKKEYHFYVYIVANSSGTLYVGMTNSITRRIAQHKEKEIEGFTKRYSCGKLVYYEHHQYVYNAIAREKEIKGWMREKKQELIKMINPHWNDLAQEFYKF